MAGPATGQDKAPVQPEYQRFFYHYVDKRSLSEKSLNLVGLSIQDVGRSFALIAGVSHYPNMPPTDRDLRPGAEDIAKLQKYLRDEEFFDEIVVLKDQNMNLDNLAFFLQSYFPERLKKFPKSRFLFAYSGHGMEEDGNGYLLTNAAHTLSDRGNSVALKLVRDLIEEDVDAAFHVLVLINACHSGTFLKRSFGGNSHLLSRNPGAHAITAGGSSEPTWSDPTLGTGSIFFEKFFAGLDGHADIWPENQDGSRGDGIITVDELATYLKAEVKYETDERQNPLVGDLSRNGSLGGFFFLNRRRQFEKGLVKEWMPGKASSFGAKAENLVSTAKEYYRSGDYASAVPLLLQAEKLGSAEAMNFLGIHYDPQSPQYTGVPKDDGKAFECFRKAGELGDPNGMSNLALMYENGQGVKEDQAQALTWFRRAADAGNSEAMIHIGFMYRDAQGGLKKNYAEAQTWIRKAADAGSSEAMTDLGAFYEEGEIVKKDYVEALNWYHKAADAGNTTAMSNIGVMYWYGRGVKKDHQDAVTWFRKAADAGDPMGLFHLALMFENGDGVQKDDAEAAKLYGKAASLGNEEAGRRLSALAKRTKRYVKSGLTRIESDVLTLRAARIENRVDGGHLVARQHARSG